MNFVWLLFCVLVTADDDVSINRYAVDGEREDRSIVFRKDPSNRLDQP